MGVFPLAMQKKGKPLFAAPRRGIAKRCSIEGILELLDAATGKSEPRRLGREEKKGGPQGGLFRLSISGYWGFL